MSMIREKYTDLDKGDGMDERERERVRVCWEDWHGDSGIQL